MPRPYAAPETSEHQGTPNEIAEVALFLALDHARRITGQKLAVDGGRLLGA